MSYIVVSEIKEPAPFALRNRPSYLAASNLWSQDVEAAMIFERVDQAIQQLDNGVELGILEQVLIVPVSRWADMVEDGSVEP